jgi:hypothetical protein
MQRALGALGAIVVLAVAVLVAVGGAPAGTAGQAAAQEPGPQPPGPFPDVYGGDTVTIPGQRDGTSAFKNARYKELQPLVPGELDFKHYQGLPEIEWWLRKWAYEHPDIVKLNQVGTSFGGHPIWQLTITNAKLGKETDKPAAYFDGGRHSGEITATESTLYLINQLVTGYGSDPDITRLVNEKTIYVRPVPNPDGSEMYRQTAQTDRSTVRPYDQDGDGRLDEDSGEDLNGDGYVSQMRKDVGAGKGNYIVDGRDPTGRTMKRVAQGEGNYTVSAEGYDNDGDGRVNEDGIGGLDLHRNYPYNWRPMSEDTGRGNTQGGAGEYPLSEPETRSVFDFLMRHPNVGAVDSMDTAAWMILRGPSSCEEDQCVHPADLKLLHHFDAVGKQLTGYGRAGNTYRDYATQSATPSEGSTPAPDPQPQALYGHGPDWGYFQFGAVWYGDELWNQGAMKDYNGDGQFGDWEKQRWCVENGYDNCFLPWTKYTDAKVGTVEIGGINPKFESQNPPAGALEPWLKNESAYNLYLAQSLSKVSIVKTKVKALTNDPDGATHEIDVTVENGGRIPTALEQAQQVKIVRPDTVQVTLPAGTGTVVGAQPSFFLKGNQRITVPVKLKLGATPPDSVTVTASSTRGGVDSRALLWSQASRKGD